MILVVDLSSLIPTNFKTFLKKVESIKAMETDTLWEDCLIIHKHTLGNSIDAVITDASYKINFMS